jgi:hypothetical protein
MKKIILLLAWLTLFIFPLKAQSLINKKWIVAEYGITDRADYGLNNTSRPLFVFFNKDSAKSAVNYSNIEFNFLANGSYTGKNVQGQVYTGKWLLSPTADKLTIDTAVYRIDFINAFTCITKNATAQVVDTTGRVDTVYSYVKLITTSTNSIVLNESQQQVTVYPIPSADFITIAFSAAELKVKEALVYNIYGQLVKIIPLTGKTGTSVIDIKDLPKGYYSLEVINTTDTRISVHKILKG